MSAAMAFASPLPTQPYFDYFHPSGVQIDFPLQTPFTSYVNVHHATKEAFISSPITTVIEKLPTQNPKTKSNANSKPFAIAADSNVMSTESLLNKSLDSLHGQQGTVEEIDIYASILQVCSHAKALEEGMQIHAHMLKTGCNHNLFLKNKLVIMYAMCGSIVDARQLFDKMSKRKLFLWNTMISRYALIGFYEEVIKLFYQMLQLGIHPDNYTFPCVLKACANLSALRQGKEIHDYIIRSGFDSDVFVGTALIDMYVKFGMIETSRHMFDKMSKRDVASWTTMIARYSQNGNAKEAMEVFRQMQLAGVKPDFVAIVSVLPAIADLAALGQGKEIHGYILRRAFEADVSVGSALIDMYIKCGGMEKFACHVFDEMSKTNVVVWNAMIGGHVQNGHANEALKLLIQMQSISIKPNSRTIASVLPACANLAALQQGKQIHNYVIRNEFESDIFVESALIDMYAKCGKIENAHKVFDKIYKRNPVSWNAVIGGYAQNGCANEALKLFREMQLTEVIPDMVTIASVLPACAQLAALQEGKEIHNYIVRHGFESDLFVGNSLIDMYAKCGCIDVARCVFDKMSQKNVVSWTAMIAGYGLHGHGVDALTLFEQMKEAGVKADHITFVALLSACSHAGLVAEGQQYFNSMSQDYHIEPSVEHYACMVDIFGRAGCLDEAHNIIKTMPLQPDVGVWGALFGACRLYSNPELAEYVAERLLEVEPENAANYLLMSNIYAAAGRWDDVAKMRAIIKDRGLKMRPGYSWIVHKKQVHAFLVGDRSHPQSEEIHSILKTLTGQMREAGYVPDTSFVLHDVEEKEKEYILCGHSEKLAIAFGLLNTSPETPIRITKNLRVCGDCHSATKFISKIVKREIIVRDANRFHQFKDGLCSCGDYW
eukprot:Gb_06173 [translate_table: standard]